MMQQNNRNQDEGKVAQNEWAVPKKEMKPGEHTPIPNKCPHGVLVYANDNPLDL